ncbi:hypothetical protein SNEBB_001003 [Seison nebaliae]|nr:hypothetical protein SNEBB_001003 [Seison nebaliae]
MSITNKKLCQLNWQIHGKRGVSTVDSVVSLGSVDLAGSSTACMKEFGYYCAARKNKFKPHIVDCFTSTAYAKEPNHFLEKVAPFNLGEKSFTNQSRSQQFISSQILKSRPPTTNRQVRSAHVMNNLLKPVIKPKVEEEDDFHTVRSLSVSSCKSVDSLAISFEQNRTTKKGRSAKALGRFGHATPSDNNSYCLDEFREVLHILDEQEVRRTASTHRVKNCEMSKENVSLTNYSDSNEQQICTNDIIEFNGTKTIPNDMSTLMSNGLSKMNLGDRLRDYLKKPINRATLGPLNKSISDIKNFFRVRDRMNDITMTPQGTTTTLTPIIQTPTQVTTLPENKSSTKLHSSYVDLKSEKKPVLTPNDIESASSLFKQQLEKDVNNIPQVTACRDASTNVGTHRRHSHRYFSSFRRHSSSSKKRQHHNCHSSDNNRRHRHRHRRRRVHHRHD